MMANVELARHLGKCRAIIICSIHQMSSQLDIWVNVELLSSAACEWFLIFLLFVDAAFSYLLTKFANYCELKVPCLLCSRPDLVIRDKKSRCYRSALCSDHIEEISSLVSCSVHNKLADVNGMCEECLMPIAMKNKSSSESYRFLVGKLLVDVERSVLQNLMLNKNIRLVSFGQRTCSCCNRTWKPKSNAERLHQVANVELARHFGGFQVKICGAIQYLNLFGVAIGYTIASSISMMAIKKSNCFHSKGDNSPCRISSNPYMIAFGVIEIIFSQIPDFDQIWWLSIVAAIMSFTYSTIGLGLGIAQVAENGKIRGSLTGISIGYVTEMEKIWRSFQALGAIAFAYSYSLILIEIQNTIKSPPSEHKTMKKATLISVAVTTIFYMFCGCFGYAAFGDLSPGNLLLGFGFYNPYWLFDIANTAIVIHLIGAYQVYCQPFFAFVEKTALEWFPDSKLITKVVQVPIPGYKPFKLNLFRLVWRTIFVIITTIISMLMPFFNDVVGILGAFGFWPLTVYFPVEMYIVQKKIPKWSAKWLSLQILSVACLIISIAAAASSFAGVISDLKMYKPFKNMS